MNARASFEGRALEPGFLEANGRRLFMRLQRPADGLRWRGSVLFVPAFNEEMNRCRSMLTQQAQALADVGIGSAWADLTGTGDSEGEHRDARWSMWLDDVAALHDRLEGLPGGCGGLVGVRLGALLALDLARRLGRALPIVLWQPVLEGSTHLTQFLRTRVAAALDRPGLARETTASLRQQLGEGRTVEIGGYEIHPLLAQAIDAASLRELCPPPGCRVLCIDTRAAPAAAEPAAPLLDAVRGWLPQDVDVELAQATGPAFWQLHERCLAPQVTAQTACWFDTLLA